MRACAALQTALRLLGEGKSSLHEELKLKRRVQRERSQRGRNLSTCSNSSDLSGQSDDSSYQETDEDRERHNQQIDSIIQVREGLAAGGGTSPVGEGCVHCDAAIFELTRSVLTEETVCAYILNFLIRSVRVYLHL